MKSVTSTAPNPYPSSILRDVAPAQSAHDVLIVPRVPVGAAAGCDLLILILKKKIKRSQPAAALTRGHQLDCAVSSSGNASSGSSCPGSSVITLKSVTSTAPNP